MQKYPSILLEKAVDELSKLPGVGRKTALRLALNILTRPTDDVDRFTAAISDMAHNITYCNICHNISDDEVCPICANPSRDASTVCVVENIQDVMAIENTQQYNGLYHVLGGIISPINGIGPSDIQLDSLVSRVAEGGVKEVILALSPTMEGDTTGFFISRKLAHMDIKITAIARGINVGGEIEYTDEVTLGRAIVSRTAFGK